jgi:hypothetical protein
MLPDISHSLIAIVAVAVISAPGPLFAQTLLRRTPNALFQPQPDSTFDRDAKVWQRFVSATVVGALGAVTLGTIGSQTGGPDNIAGVMLGVLAGGTIGSAIGAAAPRGRGRCGGSQRLSRALGGASLGLVAGIGFLLVPPLEPLFMVTIPVGSVMFMRKC